MEQTLRSAGYDVRLITLPEYDVMEYNPPDGVYGILAAPPCTEFSLAKNGSHRNRDLRTGMMIVNACLRIIQICRLSGSLKFWALENPVGYLRQFIGKPYFTFYQWWFGDMGIKRTDLWGYFHEPKRLIYERPDHPYFVKQYKSGKKNQFAWSMPLMPEWYSGQPLTRAALRAITPPGFAQAFFKANK